MNNSLSFLKKDLFLKQSELFGNEYEKSKVRHIHTFNELSVTDLSDWYNSIQIKYNFLNDIQRANFLKFVEALNYVLKNIDPKRLQINVDIVEGVDLILWRKSLNGLSIITFDEYGQIAYNYTDKDGKKIKGVFDQDVDMEKLLYRFISM